MNLRNKRLSLPVLVNNPRRLPGWQLPAERVPIAERYKPHMTILPDGELVLVAFYHTGSKAEGTKHEITTLYRSGDGGKTWSDGRDLQDVIGREYCLTCTSDGTLFLTGIILNSDTAYEGYPDSIHSYIHRSTDNGMTWTRTKVLIDGELRHEAPYKEHWTVLVRNIVELPDGTLLLGVSLTGLPPSNIAHVNAYMWKSTDGGVTWEQNRPVTVLEHYEDKWCGFFDEGFIYRQASGRLLYWHRCNGESPMHDMHDGRVRPTGTDQVDRLTWYESSDDGMTWSRRGDFGDYGQMYPRVLKLRDGRLLMTYTQRDLLHPLGLRARLSYDDGDTWDFDSDQIMIEGFTPWGISSGGGFGGTVQIEDSTLVSCYSWRDSDKRIHSEVARWKLP